MKISSRSRVSLLIATFGVAAVAPFAAGQAAADSDPLTAALARWVGDQPGAIVAGVVEPDGVRFAVGGQWATGEERRADADTLFEIGSITKVFTSLLLADAVEREKIELDTPVGAPFAESTVTYRQLSTHTSGLPRLTADFAPPDLNDPYAELGINALVASFATGIADLGNEPHPWDYSNLGAAVLGQAVAHVEERDYAALVQERIFVPFGMAASTASDPTAAQIALQAPGHNVAGPVSAWHFQAYAAAGSIVSSARDMTRFIQALLDPAATPLAGAITRTLQEQTSANAPDKMGLGWLIREIDGHPVYWHNGGTGGYRSFLGIDPARGRGIVVLAARDAGVEGVGFGWLQGAQPPVIELRAEALEELVGNYPLAATFALQVTRERTQLYVQATGQPRFPVFPSASDEFYYTVVEASLSFQRDEAGNVTGVVLHQNGRDLPAPKRE